MKMSAKARYGLYAVTALARDYNVRVVPTIEIASKLGVGDKYMEQIFSILKNRSIVVAQRGAYGGYMLSKSPEKISVGEVLRSLEDNLTFVNCLEKDCRQSDKCPSKRLFDNLYKHMNAYLDGISISELQEERI